MAPYTEAKIRSSVYGAIYGDGVAPYMAPYTELEKISVYGAIYGAIYGVYVAPYTAPYIEYRCTLKLANKLY